MHRSFNAREGKQFEQLIVKIIKQINCYPRLEKWLTHTSSLEESEKRELQKIITFSPLKILLQNVHLQFLQLKNGLINPFWREFNLLARYEIEFDEMTIFPTLFQKKEMIVRLCFMLANRNVGEEEEFLSSQEKKSLIEDLIVKIVYEDDTERLLDNFAEIIDKFSEKKFKNCWDSRTIREILEPIRDSIAKNTRREEFITIDPTSLDGKKNNILTAYLLYHASRNVFEKNKTYRLIELNGNHTYFQLKHSIIRRKSSKNVNQDRFEIIGSWLGIGTNTILNKIKGTARLNENIFFYKKSDQKERLTKKICDTTCCTNGNCQSVSCSKCLLQDYNATRLSDQIKLKTPIIELTKSAVTQFDSYLVMRRFFGKKLSLFNDSCLLPSERIVISINVLKAIKAYLETNSVLPRDLNFRHFMIGNHLTANIIHLDRSEKIQNRTGFYDIPLKKLIMDFHFFWTKKGCTYPFESIKDSQNIFYDLPDDLALQLKNLMQILSQENQLSLEKIIDEIRNIQEKYPKYEEETYAIAKRVKDKIFSTALKDDKQFLKTLKENFFILSTALACIKDNFLPIFVKELGMNLYLLQENEKLTKELFTQKIAKCQQQLLMDCKVFLTTIERYTAYYKEIEQKLHIKIENTAIKCLQRQLKETTYFSLLTNYLSGSNLAQFYTALEKILEKQEGRSLVAIQEDVLYKMNEYLNTYPSYHSYLTHDGRDEEVNEHLYIKKIIKILSEKDDYLFVFRLEKIFQKISDSYRAKNLVRHLTPLLEEVKRLSEVVSEPLTKRVRRI